MKFEVRPALPEDVGSGVVWLTTRDRIPQRSVVRIVNPVARKSLCCEVQVIGRYFVERYNARIDSIDSRLRLVVDFDSSDRALPGKDDVGLMFADSFHRGLLGDLTDFDQYDLDVTVARRWRDAVEAALQHPQLGIRLATILGLLGFGLGALAVALGVVGILIAAIPKL